MLQINCPWCGTRAEIEFTCGGEGGIMRWFNALRDTVTYRFEAVWKIGEQAPAALTHKENT